MISTHYSGGAGSLHSRLSNFIICCNFGETVIAGPEDGKRFGQINCMDPSIYFTSWPAVTVDYYNYYEKEKVRLFQLKFLNFELLVSYNFKFIVLTHSQDLIKKLNRRRF